MGRKAVAVLLAVVSLGATGCSESPKEKQESKAKREYFECQSGLETPTCTQQKNEEAREKEINKAKEEVREAERLKGEGP